MPERRLTQQVRNRQGVALPVALLALVAVSIIVTSVLLSSATEVSLSAAHQDATRSLFRAEGAIEAYVAQSQLALDTITNRRYLPPGGSNRDSVFITVSLLGEVTNPTPSFPKDSTFAVTATPIRGGRQVVAMIDKVNRAMTMDIQAGVVSGDSINIKGNTTISDGSDSKICSDSIGGKAIQVSTGDAVTTGGNVKVIGENETVSTPPADMVQELFGTNLQTLVSRADIKFARGTFGTTAVSSDRTTVDKLNPPATPYNWGCPRDVYLNQDGTTACILDGDETHLPIVAIDASNSDGSFGTVTVNLSHGQGMLIVYNGNLSIQGNFAYKGAILVEGNFDIRASGGSATAPKIEGAVIGLGMGPAGAESVIDHDITGTPTIRYNRCALDLLQTSWQQTKSFLSMGGRTYNWFEVVR